MTTSAPPMPRSRRLARTLIVLLTFAITILLILYFTGPLKPRPRIAIVTGGQSPYWDQVLRGASDAARRYKVSLTKITPPSNEPAQTEALQALMEAEFDGVGLSVLEPNTQAGLVAQLAAETPLVTYDSDCPVAGRRCFVGTDNYEAGRMAAQYIRSAIPDGGDVIIAIGSLEKQNGQRRRQGLIDDLLERRFEPTRAADPVDAVLEGPKYRIVVTLVDGMDPQKATALAADALKQHANVKCFAALFAYNAPSILKALGEGNKLGQIQLVAFDTNDETLAGIEAGHIYATIAQDPYSMGYATVRILGDVARGDSRAVPLFGVLNVGVHPVTREHVAAVRQNLPLGPATTNPS